jgi:hypothetical protein
MSVKLDCQACGGDLTLWNNGHFLRFWYCPACGERLSDEQCEALYYRTTPEEVADMIQGHLLDLFDNRDTEISADDLATAAWERECGDEAVLCSNYQADWFAIRHADWIVRAVDHAKMCGGGAYYLSVKDDCMDRFLVLAFIDATEHYVFDQLGIDRHEGVLSKPRIREIKHLISRVAYDGKF